MVMLIDDLHDDKVYGIETLKAVLKELGLPHSKWWILKAEKKGLLPDPRLLSKLEPRKYPGSMIKDIVTNLMARLNENN